MRCRALIILTLCGLLTTVSLAQVKNADDIIAARKWLSEYEILMRLQNQNDIHIQAQDWSKLRQAGFSDSFISSLRELLQTSQPARQVTAEKAAQGPGTHSPAPGTAKSYAVKISIEPPGSGKVRITPQPGPNGHLPAHSVVELYPQAQAPYLFDRWQGDLHGYQPLRLKLERNLNLTAVFRIPRQPEPAYKIDNPVTFRETRRAGYVYKSTVIGVVKGRGVNSDWGIAGEVDYKYIYHIDCTSHVLSNNGTRVCEKRKFDHVQETLIISKYRFHLDLHDNFAPLKKLLINIGECLELGGDCLQLSPETSTQVLGRTFSKAGALLRFSTEVVDMGLRFADKITIDADKAKWLLDKLPGKHDFVAQLKQRLSNPKMGRILGYAPQLKLLEGKTFNLEYEDGLGLVKVEIDDPHQFINTQEQELLQRAFYMSDYYIFRDCNHPRRQIHIGDSWQVDARTFAGMLDPRLRHRVQGRITLTRVNNQIYQHKRMAVFKLQQGKIQLVPLNGSQKIEGNVAFTDGTIFYDLDKLYVAKSFCQGQACYHEVSTDHMFFRARLSTTPFITIRYECTAQPE